MKFKTALLSVLVLALASCASNRTKENQDGRIKVIFETDLGNDVDDALAMDMLHKYIDDGRIEVLAIMLNKNGKAPVEYADILNTWYGHNDIPIGVIRNGADCETDAVNYAQAVCNLVDSEGNPVFSRSLASYSDLPDAHTLYRKILAGQPDSSVVIVSVGFSTNLARLLDTPGDDISSETGKELVASKVKLLTTMAGCFNNPELCEYNVVKDIPAARKVFEEWPGKVVTSPFEVGVDILYPASSIENDFGWAGMYHPVVEAYKSYLPMPYDRPAWDLTALLYAVEGDGMFSLSPAGWIKVMDDGSTAFSEDPSGNRYYLQTDKAQNDAIREYFVSLIPAVPRKYSPAVK